MKTKDLTPTKGDKLLWKVRPTFELHKLVKFIFP